MSASRARTSPVSFTVGVASLPRKGMPVAIEADARQRELLAGAHGLVAVKRFAADLLVSPWKADGVRVSGKVEADIVQECVVTLEPVRARVEEAVSALLVPEGSRLLRPDTVEGGEILLDAEGPDAPESFAGNSIDAGALAEEFFALGIDPYPRKQGAELEPSQGHDRDEPGPMHDMLKGLRRRG
jgi:hypothetical protein